MSTSGIITVPFHIGDFLSGTMHMDTLEKGAYLMLILAHYQSGEDGLQDDDKKTFKNLWRDIKSLVENTPDNTREILHRKWVMAFKKVH